MKPALDTWALVTATLDPAGAVDCFQSWMQTAQYHRPVYVVWGDLTVLETPGGVRAWRTSNHEGYDVISAHFTPGVTTILHKGGGVVPAFAKGVAEAFKNGAQAVVCLHDDVLIQEAGWDTVVDDALALEMKFGGFGGAVQLGSADLYHTPYDPMQLARGGFVSNLQDAEAHGARRRTPQACVVFDGFCQIGTRDWFGAAWAWLAASGIQHHFYDGILGCLAARAGVQPGRMLPIACHHFGGRTAVGSREYQAWAKTQNPDGDQGFWEDAHAKGYREFQDVLPLRVRP